MASSSERAEWHLTQNGWVKGSTKCEFEGIKRVIEPADRVKTCIVSEKTYTGAQGVDREVREIWFDKGQLDQITALTEKFGDCPARL